MTSRAGTRLKPAAVNKYNDEEVTGTYSWKYNDEILTTTGRYIPEYVIFTPDDQVSYKPTEFRTTVTITCSHDDSDFIDTGTVYTEATCTTNGRKQQKCPYCGITTRITIPALGHDYDSGTWVTNDTQHWKQCSRCDSTDTPENHVFNGLVCETCGYEKAQVITVTIIWSGMAFTYTDGLWDPESHTYDASCASDSNTVTVTNHSNAAINAKLTYKAESNYSGSVQ